MFVSLNPSYFCNFRCNFCYLSEDQLSNPKCIPLDTLKAKLEEITKRETIEVLDLYGGEIALLPKQYLNDLFILLRSFTNRINVITNMSAVPDIFLVDDINLFVSFDFDCREKSDIVMRNILATNKNIHILMLASSDLIQKDVDEMITIFNGVRNIKTVEIKPYSSNQANQLPVPFSDFEEFIKQWILSPVKKEFEFVNEHQIKSSLNFTKNAYSDDHIYITPTGKYAILEFDLNDNEYFHEFDNLEYYDIWTKKEKERVKKNKFCSNCKYMGTCLSEHLREVKDISSSCNGFRFLLDWYDNERL